MSYMEKLLKELKVEWSVLGNDNFVDIANSGRKPVKASLRIAGKTPYYGANNIQDYVEGYTHNGEYLLIAEDGSASLENYSIQYVSGKFWANNHVHVIGTKPGLNLRFLFHYLRIVNFIPVLSGGGRAKLTKSKMVGISIPIPPLEVQKEIVRILDTFTELITELTTELTARTKQYSYYRDELLSFEEGEVEWKSLGEIGEIKRGVAFTKKQAVFGKFPVVANAAEPIIFHNEFNRNGEFIVVARSGANAGLISYWNEELFLTDAFSIHPNDSVLNTKFAYYFLKKHQREIHLMKRGVGVPHVRASDFEIYKIPVPSLEEQVRIVTILDKFDMLTNSINEGLPKEIELRKKQYEYYREMLLTFPKDKLEA
jgi:type I restriction enzyme S subunit